MKYIFNNQITSISIFPKSESMYFSFREYKKLSFWRKRYQPGIYEYDPWSSSYEYVIGDDLKEFNKRFYMSDADMKIYHNPYINIRTSDDRLETKSFPTLDHMNDFLEDILSKNDHIIIK